MDIRSLDNAWALTLSVTDTETEHLPSVGISIALDGEFSAKNPDAWYEYDAIIGFVAALRRVEKSRTGNASLDSMSPGECSIRIECVGGEGSILLHINMYRITYFSDAAGHAKNTVSVTFEVNREFLHRIISDFSELAAICCPS